MHFARFQITAAAAEYFNRIRQVAKRIANIRLTKQKKDRHLADCQDACLLFLSFGFSETLCDYAAVP